MPIQFFICGARGTYPAFESTFLTYGKETSCYVVKENDYAIVLDCGSGLINAKELLKGCRKVDVLISHVHYDHVMGLAEIRDFAGDAAVDFYGEFVEWFDAEKKHSTLFNIQDIIKEDIHPISMNVEFFLFNGFKVVFTRANHPDNSSMITLWKDDVKICYTGDYEHVDYDNIVNWAMDADLLVADGTYTEEEKKFYKGRGHSSWKDNGDIASKAHVKNLVIVHHDFSHTDEILAKEEEKAKALYPFLSFGKQGDVWNF